MVCASQPAGRREYPEGFGRGLHGALSKWMPQPRLRQKMGIDLSLSDKELFQALPLGDVWEDAKLIEVYRYMRLYKKASIPQSWLPALEELDAELNRVCPN